jgi:hypothetical protein
VGKFGLIAYIFAIALYALIGLLAIAPRIVGGLGLDATPVRVEAVLLTILVFAGVNVAWLLLFEEHQPTAPTRSRPARERRQAWRITPAQLTATRHRKLAAAPEHRNDPSRRHVDPPAMRFDRARTSLDWRSVK